jgi:hypothetical protein
MVLVDGAVIGRAVPREEAPLANRGMSKIHAGWPTRRGRLWRASAEGAKLNPEDAEELAGWLRREAREKRNRRGAANELLRAYDEAGVELPEPPISRAA